MGFRLTSRAFDIMLDRGYSYWTYELSDYLSNRDLILMDQKLLHPYYINKKNISFFYEPIAIAMALTHNNVYASVEMTYC